MKRLAALLPITLAALIVWPRPTGGEPLPQRALLEAPTIRLTLPVDCEMGPVCVVQHYVDMADGPEAADHTCGSLTYDGHRGIDIRTLTRAQMEDGVDVVAAAPGIVLLTRDGMADRSIRNEADYAAVAGRFSGNTVELVHENGWSTKYSHLKQGSVSVKPGERVQRGDRLGQIGLSGKTQFPHVEFSVSLKRRALDPFTGLPPGSGCGRFERSLWSESAQAVLSYRPGGLLMSGLSGEVPAYPEILDRRTEAPVPDDPPALVAWFVAWGLRAGDRVRLRVIDDTGAILAAQEIVQEKTQIRNFYYTGRRRPAEGWRRGRYRASVKIERRIGSEVVPIAERTHVVTLR